MLAAFPDPVVSLVLVRFGLEAEDRAEDSDTEVLEMTGVRGGS